MAAPPTGAQSLVRNISEDWLAVGCASVLLAASFFAVWGNQTPPSPNNGAAAMVKASSPLKPWLAKPGKWTSNPWHAFRMPAAGETQATDYWKGVVGVFACISLLLALATRLRNRPPRSIPVCVSGRVSIGNVGIYACRTERCQGLQPGVRTLGDRRWFAD